jgi:hypothetical protein
MPPQSGQARRENEMRYDVYNQAGELVEGGFFSRAAAQECADQWTRDTGSKHVVKASKK